MPDFENPISQFCSVPEVEKFVTTQDRNRVIKVSYWTLALSGLSAYQGSSGNVGSMTVRLYWSSASRDANVSSPSPKSVASPLSTGST